MKIVSIILWLLLGLATAQAQVTSSLVDNATRTSSNGTAATVTGAAFGTASAGRVLVVPILIGSQGQQPSSATIGGVAATISGSQGASGGNIILSAVVPTGTSGNIVVNFASADGFFTNGVIALTGAANATPSAVLDTLSGAGTINVGAGGSLVAFTFAGSSGSWTGATGVRTDTSLGVALSTATFDNSGSAITNRPVSYSTGVILVAAAFDAGGAPPVTVTPKRTLMGIGN